MTACKIILYLLKASLIVIRVTHFRYLINTGRKNYGKACMKKAAIPMKGRAESLNAAAAGAIVMWEMMK